jgi:hypothetical protein
LAAATLMEPIRCNPNAVAMLMMVVVLVVAPSKWRYL